MTDQVFIESPFGLLALSPGELSEAVARAKEMAVALGSGPRSTRPPEEAEQQISWLTIEEIANRTNLKKSWLYQEVRANRIPHRHFGKQVRIPASYLAAPVPKSGSRHTGGQ